jgi:hypothetical protein
MKVNNQNNSKSIKTIDHILKCTEDWYTHFQFNLYKTIKTTQPITVSHFRFLKPAHFGTMVSNNDLNDYINIFSKHSFIINKRFKSVVLVEQLRNKYKNTQINIDIVKLSNPLNYEIELFIPVNGLNDNEIIIEKKASTHYAIHSSNNKSTQYLISILNISNFNLIQDGNNPIEKTRTLYFESQINNITPTRVEIITDIFI